MGGSDLIDAKRLEDFDYAALGHIHRPQITGKDHLCYSGSPLKYSQSEIPYHKSVVVAQLGQKGHLMIRRQSLPVLRDMRMIEGNFDQILKSNPNEKRVPDLVFFSLLDRVLVPNAMNRLRTIYPNALGIFMGRRNENGISLFPRKRPLNQWMCCLRNSTNLSPAKSRRNNRTPLFEIFATDYGQGVTPMKPIRLEFNAFGPFAQKRRSLTLNQWPNPGFFDLWPTGAGKTTIFDGICFALYGEASGALRQNEDFKSDFSDPSDLCFVRYSFWVREKKFEVYRSPKQKKQRKWRYHYRIRKAELVLPDGTVLTGWQR